MKYKEDNIDIQSEFEKILPPTPRKSLFDENDDYESLREYIITQPYNSLHKRSLPFAEVELMDYIDYKRNEAIDKATHNRKHLFFIRQSTKGKEEFCDAVGFYQHGSKSFILMPYSYIVAKVHGQVPHRGQRLTSCRIDGVNKYTTQSISFISPEDAAIFVLGQGARLEEWIDRRGKGLLEYYPDLKKQSEPLPSLNIDTLSQSIHPAIPNDEKKIFTISIEGVCKASGYFDMGTGYFFIMKGSLLALKPGKDYEKSASGMARNRMLAASCTCIGGFYVVNKDTKCRSASAAASYVLGRASSYIEWEDIKGNGLKDYFPERFYRKKDTTLRVSLNTNKTHSEDSVHLFYINKQDESGSECKASGYFDVTMGSFILKEGSKWSNDVTKDYRYTASETKRRIHIQKDCIFMIGCIIQTKDIICDSPSTAASFVLGRFADGWEEWMDKNGNSLKEVYHK